MRPARTFAVLPSQLPARVQPSAAGASFQAATPAEPAVSAAAKTALATQLMRFETGFVAASRPVGRRAAFVRATSGAVCGDVGCPSALLLWSGAGWSAAWTGVSFGKGTVLGSAHSGLRDVTLAADHVSIVLRFDGRSYVEKVAPK